MGGTNIERNRTIVLEVIAMTVEDAVAARRGGADRIELVADLHVGGITPSEHVTRSVVRAVDIPVYVMIRPRGGDALYSRDELAQMAESADMAREAGAAGLVTGALRSDLSIDVEGLAGVLERGRLPTTFHRAFDSVPYDAMFEALDVLFQVPFVERVLTSGGCADAFAGRHRLRRLAAYARGLAMEQDSDPETGGTSHPGWPIPSAVENRGHPLSIMPGGGVTVGNVRHLVRDSGVYEVHVGSAARMVSGTPGPSPRAQYPEHRRPYDPPVAEDAVRRLKKILLGERSVPPL